MLTGLIIACEDIAGGTGLRAELPVAGQTVLEQQVRVLAEAGAERTIAIAERLPPGLAAALARLRRDGLVVEVLRRVDDVAQRVRPDDRLLVMGDGIVTDTAAAERLLGASPPAILTIPDAPETREWELIDASARWAGLLLVDGDLVRRTARMLGDWDLQSTLLRNAVQAGAERVPLERGPLLAQVADPAAALAAEQAISQAAARRPTGLLDRYVFDPLARAIAPRAMAAMIDPAWLRGGASGLLILAALVFMGGWRWPGLVLAMLSGPVDVLGRHLAGLTMRLRKDHKRWTQLRYGAASAALLALGWNTRDFGWGTLALAAGTIGVMTALLEHQRWIGKPQRRPLWLAEPDLLVWLLAPFAVAGWWPAGLAAQAVLAFASLLAVQRLTRRQT
ncbi:hypothetical protein GON01_11415 [Sphingomonas sp. MAH-20]|uniref:Uncharacterized protein n=1 Tax=Sphingomonas horti TaxID=2682842 RepID=A0A6I4J2I6_9SPHN|nr:MULTISPECIES: hypothetical protein [Sphingomonas]MBA2919656.1 hypothetical protein [Sphingomonas sp. CGMCC 1.13658]MVO78536.1 hypothetical protein [Sphingomonas horti]